jgi:type I restriction enzyme R subunit
VRLIFIIRLELIGEIEDGAETGAFGPATEDLLALRGGRAERLHQEVSGMHIDNFVVRPKRRWVEQYQHRDAWRRLSREDRAEFAEQIAGLPSAYQDDDLAVKQFDYLLLTQLAVLRVDPSFTKLQAGIIGIAAALEALGNSQPAEPFPVPQSDGERCAYDRLVRLISLWSATPPRSAVS